MITEVNAVNFRQNLGEMINQVQYRNDSSAAYAAVPADEGLAEIDDAVKRERKR